MGSDRQSATTYPTEEQYDRWKRRADEMDMTVSEFMQSMIEAGMKKFDASVEPDETNRELRQQRNDLRDELQHARERIDDLEDRLHHGERASIRRYIENNPGASYDDIVQHVIDTAAGRVTTHLDDMEGDDLRSEDGGFYPANSGGRE
jgi:predicted  nucleic acid-binding Zn-ribbon protein